MIKTAKAFAEQPGIKEKIKEFKVVSTGTDVAAQLGAIEDFINQGYDAIVTIAVSPEGFDRVIRLADKNNVVIVPFDNVLDTDKVMMVNEDQLEMGKMSADFLRRAARRQEGAARSSRCAACPATRSTATAIVGFREVMEAHGAKLRDRRGRRQLGRRHRAEGDRRRASPCTASSTASSRRAARPARSAP